MYLIVPQLVIRHLFRLADGGSSYRLLRYYATLVVFKAFCVCDGIKYEISYSAENIFYT